MFDADEKENETDDILLRVYRIKKKTISSKWILKHKKNNYHTNLKKIINHILNDINKKLFLKISLFKFHIF